MYRDYLPRRECVCGLCAPDLLRSLLFFVSVGNCWDPHRLHSLVVWTTCTLTSFLHTYACLMRATQVLMDELPPSWEGKLLFVGHMAAFVSGIRSVGFAI